MAVEIRGIGAVLTDIEGTTSSIAFVKDVLFPYARAHLRRFVNAHRDDPAVQAQLAAAAREAGIAAPTSQRVVATLLRWIDADRKTTPLKALEGMIWKSGYAQGDYTAHVYADVPAKLRAWKAAGLKLYVYSSGSIAAQQLFFGHSEAGDLAGLFDGWFDTTVGGKRERGSYLRIAEAIGLPSPAIVFLSDITAELDAAHDTGMRAVQINRPPSEVAAGATHPCVADFNDIILN